MCAINVKKMGLAVGATLVIFRLGCILVFSLLSRDQAISYFNTLLHGVDLGPILKMETSALNVFYGLAQVFILGWLGGALVASVYNLPLCCLKKIDKSGTCCH